MGTYGGRQEGGRGRQIGRGGQGQGGRGPPSGQTNAVGGSWRHGERRCRSASTCGSPRCGWSTVVSGAWQRAWRWLEPGFRRRVASAAGRRRPGSDASGDLAWDSRRLSWQPRVRAGAVPLPLPPSTEHSHPFTFGSSCFPGTAAPSYRSTGSCTVLACTATSTGPYPPEPQPASSAGRSRQGVGSGSGGGVVAGSRARGVQQPADWSTRPVPGDGFSGARRFPGQLQRRPGRPIAGAPDEFVGAVESGARPSRAFADVVFAVAAPLMAGGCASGLRPRPAAAFLCL